MKRVYKALFILAMVATLFTGCASTQETVKLKSTPPLRAEGQLEVTMKADHQTEIELRVHDLVKPTSIGVNAYVAWAIPLDAHESPLRVGALSMEADRKGELDATVPLNNFWLIVTAELMPNGRAPAGAQIFSAEIRRVEEG